MATDRQPSRSPFDYLHAVFRTHFGEELVFLRRLNSS